MSDTNDKSASAQKSLPPLLKLALELGPLLVFFITNARAGIFAGTAAFMVASVIALAVMWVMAKRIAVMPLVTAVVVMVFGGLTLALQDDLFIKLKPTIVNSLFAAVLLGGLAFGKPLLKLVFDAVFDLTDEGWRKLTLRWALFFIVLAVINEVVWRTQTTDFWVSFKVFGIMPLTFAFALSQMGLIQRHTKAPDGEN